MTVSNPIRRRIAALWAFALLASALILQTLPAEAQGYRIKAGDQLQIEVLEDPSLNRTVLVAPDGRISVPSAGTVRASGRTVETVQNILTQRLESNFASTPNVYVAIAQLAPVLPPAPPRPPEPPETISVYVVGEANSPGLIEVEPGTTVLQMFAVMGGFTNFAATKRIQLRRTDPNTNVENVYKLNFDAVKKGRASNLQTPLADGDVIFVPQRRLFE